MTTGNIAREFGVAVEEAVNTAERWIAHLDRMRAMTAELQELEIEAEKRDEVAEIEAELDAEEEFMDDGLCSPMPQSEQPSGAEGPLSRSRWAMSLSWYDLLRQHRDSSPLVARAAEEEAIETEIRRRLACDEVPTELETRLAQWRADNPPPTPEQMASIKVEIRGLARRRKARLLAERDRQSEPNNLTWRDWNRQAEEHNATTLSLLNFSEPPLGWIWIGEDHDQGCALAEGASSMLDLLPFPLPHAWERYKLSHDPPGMWCGFSRVVDDLDNCTIRVGVHACGSRWELQPDITVPYDGFLVKAREWAWAWYERRHGLMAKIPTMVTSLRADRCGPYPSRALAQRLAFAQRLVDRAPFHRVLCWHDEWVAEVEAWIERPSPHLPEALR